MKSVCSYCGKKTKGKTGDELASKAIKHMTKCPGHPSGRVVRVLARLYQTCPYPDEASREYSDAYWEAGKFLSMLAVQIGTP